MNKPKHPPVIDAGGLFYKRGKRWYFLMNTPDDFCIEEDLNYVIRLDCLKIIPALQRCGWLDLRSEDKEKIVIVLEAACVKSPACKQWRDCTSFELSEACEYQARLWAEWEKRNNE